MALAPGTRLGPYDIQSALGAGGMGEVYRARDRKLQREVAIKILPPAFAGDPDRLARFEREAQVLASLSHPNIATIHGFESADGVHALVLELIEGPTLADRIAQGPVPIDEALPIARQIAEALETAHEHGIIHRDLKPSNVKLRPDGAVKVLDFGLAKLSEPAIANASGALSMSPTITSPAMMTAGGMILGTAAYMSPEQARGKNVDRRADIWAFGCVVFEMLTSRRPFEGEDISLTLSNILQRDPDWGALPRDTPAPIRRLIARALQKDPKKRLSDMASVRLDIDDAMAAPATDASGPTRERPRRVLMASLAGAIAGALAAAAVLFALGRSGPANTVVRAAIPLEQPFDLWLAQSSVAVSPDGLRIVYRPVGGGPLYSRLIHERQGAPIAGTERAFNPFFSPDGQWLAFFSDAQLKKMSLAGGSLVTLARLPVNSGDVGYRGATWADNGTIVFAPSTGAGLFQVSDQGGEATPLTAVNRQAGETNHRWPHMLPGSKAIVYTVKSTNIRSFDDAQLVVRSLETGEQRAIAQGAYAQYASSGHLVYGRAGALYAVPFDAATLQATGPPVKVIDGVTTLPESGAAQFALSRDGVLVYAAGDAHTAERTLLWVDRAGTARPVADRRALFQLPSLSRDGRRALVFIDSAYGALWLFDIERGTFTRVSDLPGDTDRAIFGPGESHITFSADTEASGKYRTFVVPADGSSSAELLIEAAGTTQPRAWSPDGSVLLYTMATAATGLDVWAYAADTKTSTPYLNGSAQETQPVFSPNGRWVAYMSDESGRFEIYVRPFSGRGTRVQISTAGGAAPVWSRDGRELFFVNGNTLLTVPVDTGETFRAGTAAPLITGPYEFGDIERNYDVTPDGQRFITIDSRLADAPRALELVVNWFEELKRLAPAK